MLSSNLAEAQSGVVDLTHQDPALVEFMLRWIYDSWGVSDDLDLKPDNALAKFASDDRTVVELNLHLLHLADELRMPNLQKFALDKLCEPGPSATPEQFAKVCKQAFNSDEHRSCDKVVYDRLWTVCTGRFTKGVPDMETQSYRDMLAETSILAEKVAGHFHERLSATPGYLTAKCQNYSCPLRSYRWVMSWTGSLNSLRCIYCGQTPISMQLGQTPNWDHLNKRRVRCDACGSKFEYWAEVQYMRRCINCNAGIR